MSLGNSGATKSFLDQVKKDAERIQLLRQREAEEDRKAREEDLKEATEAKEKTTKKTK